MTEPSPSVDGTAVRPLGREPGGPHGEPRGAHTTYQLAKRVLDVTVAVAGLVCTAPLGLVIALLIRWRMGAPVLFRQRRPGRGGHPFVLLKLRTMTVDGGAVPPLGRVLRALSLDEIPQLLNVLRGEMSLVGPRPLLMEYLPHYSPRQARRHEVPPGITGWAQVNGRNRLTWDEQFELDVWYVEHASLAVDAHILFRTLLKLVRRDPEEVNSVAQRTPFTRSEPEEV